MACHLDPEYGHSCIAHLYYRFLYRVGCTVDLSSIEQVSLGHWISFPGSLFPLTGLSVFEVETELPVFGGAAPSVFIGELGADAAF